MKATLKFLLIIVVFVVVSAVVREIASSNQATSTQVIKPAPQAVSNTAQNAKTSAVRKSFIDGCTQEGATASACGCAWNKLVELYPDFATNTARWDRIISTGYTQAETDAVVSCL